MNGAAIKFTTVLTESTIASPDFPQQVRDLSSRGVDWLFYFELRSFAAFNNTDKIIYHVREG
jgi:hypothetical protein